MWKTELFKSHSNHSVENELPRGKEPLWHKKEIAVALGRTEAEGLEGTEHSQDASAGLANCV